MRLLCRKILCPIEKRTHREQSAVAVGHDRDAFIVILQMRQQLLELCRFCFERREVPVKRGFEAIKDEVIVSIEPRIIEQDFRLAPGADIITGESVHEYNHVLSLKDVVSQVQQTAFVM